MSKQCGRRCGLCRALQGCFLFTLALGYLVWRPELRHMPLAILATCALCTVALGVLLAVSE